MNLNPKKYKIMDICFLDGARLPPITINSEVVSQVESFKLLGTTISDCLKWSDHADAIVSNASKHLSITSISPEEIWNSPQKTLRVFTLP